MNVSIVILAWNASHVTRACLNSLKPTLRKGDQVIVVDNGSTDDTAHMLTEFDWIDTVTCQKNYGFAGGNNRGAELAKHEVIIFLNNDTLFPHREWIGKLTDIFNSKDVVASGPASDNVSGVQGEAKWAASSTSFFAVKRLVGFCLAVRRSTFEAVGGWDEGFGLGGYDDDDLCLRLSKYGHLVFCTRSFVSHVGHQTFDANGLDWYAIQENNRLYFEKKHG